MDNMLYVIAGLIVILIIVGILLLRSNNAEQPPVYPSTVDDDIDADTTAVTHAHPSRSAVADDASGHIQFDDIAVAQRFMDQQRYDKAIEVLKRGLLTKPNDSKLSLKLLNIYALINQEDDFNNTFNAIQANGDMESIEKSRQLKALIDEEKNQTSVDEAPVESDSSTGFDTLDLGLDHLDYNMPAAQTSDSPITPAAPTPVVSDEFAVSSDQPEFSDKKNVATNNDAFELTLDDLETNLEADLLKANLEADLVNNIDMDNDISVHAAAPLDTQLPKPESRSTPIEDVANNIDNDFILDFDFDTDTDTDTDSSIDFNDVAIETEKVDNQFDFEDNNAGNKTLEEPNFESNDFLFDLGDLAVETDTVVESVPTESIPTATISTESTLTDAVTDDSLDVNDTDDDFVLLSDEQKHHSVETPNVEKIALVDDSLVFSDISLDTKEEDVFVFDDISLESQEDDAFTVNDASLETKEEAPTFGDDSLVFDDSFDLDDHTSVDELDITTLSPAPTPTVVAPVITENSDFEFDSSTVDTTSHTNFDTQFATDFDFVKTLDHHQVTLDLANQYLNLGEYDSAKRLLNEVVMDGNHEQQQQAHALLARTT